MLQNQQHSKTLKLKTKQVSMGYDLTVHIYVRAVEPQWS